MWQIIGWPLFTLCCVLLMLIVRPPRVDLANPTVETFEEPPEPRTLDEIGEQIDEVLYTYAMLAGNDVRDTLILEIARERIERLRREYEDLEMKAFEKQNRLS